MIDELNRNGSGGFSWGAMGGLGIGLPPVLNFGNKFQKDKFGIPCLLGKKIICLAITEPSGGSDVANLQCRAVKTDDGRHYIVNGEKKWITNGAYAGTSATYLGFRFHSHLTLLCSDYFTVAVRTGEGKGMAGLSLLIIDRNMPGVTARYAYLAFSFSQLFLTLLMVRQMKCSGVWSSGTGYITFEDVKVPVENLIGKENSGFKYIMFNFNHERFMTCAMGLRMARVCVEEAFTYSFKRKTFGKRLIDHAVIRNKLAHMIRQVEATHAWMEQITYQMKTMSHKDATEKLGGPLALLKAQMSITVEHCAREAAQIFGGLAYTRGGQGEKVERIYREVRAYAIPAGSEEIMLDLGVRMAQRGAKV